MKKFRLEPGRPVYNMQHFLRVIGQTYNDFRPPIPDGIFGTQTEDAVKGFQKRYDMPVTGAVNNDTWDKIIEIYRGALIVTQPQCGTVLFPRGEHVIEQGDVSAFHYPIQAAMYVISGYYDNISGFDISDTHAGEVIKTVKQLQRVFGIEDNGNICANCWRHISRIYENIIVQQMNEANGEKIVEEAENLQRISGKFVGIDEIKDDMRHEQQNAASGGREGVFTPRMAPYSALGNTDTGRMPDMGADNTETERANMPEENMTNENTANENTNENTNENMANDIRTSGNTAENTEKENMSNGHMGQPPKREPLKWRFY